ncbi:hypothetical protein [Carnobacterium divergens]|uniref:Uncharacterized protein n=1 Tax=Carnobacterium divergens TaxID=2748 RepID=A0AAW8RB34_CARDV|nr:hypothetical protein [Carnobacterium divergens]MDT1959006.1 hypothetical protein [Carnobacterium divergens]MDT1974974.1 hypothetical protein [Carnobacterium divergens]MDT2012938.1 hypothetical protein [Carnobacterium divergens]
MIEDNWKDTVIYYVEFTTLKNIKINKAIVLDINYSIEEVTNIINKNFSNIKEINRIDYWEDCLSLKIN